ncbi:MAG: hypothetical protein KF816_11420 [Melioribacteraceae bacterium]|nr:hypothetical protein [Melioribacteraceae bacterium]
MAGGVLTEREASIKTKPAEIKEGLMNATLVKKMRKYAKRNYKLNLDDVLQTVCAENLIHRFIFCLKVIFKIYKKKTVTK